MKKILIFIFISTCLMAQSFDRVYDFATYANSDTSYSQSFGVADSFQVMVSASDTIDVDLYVMYSASGVTWTTTAKLLDLDKNAAIDTAVFYPSVSYPISRAKLKFIFAASGNDSEANGKFGAFIKHFGK